MAQLVEEGKRGLGGLISMRNKLRWALLSTTCLVASAWAQDDGSVPSSEEVPVVENLTNWQTWWDWNESYYLQLAEHVRAAPTSSGDSEFFIGTGQTDTPARDVFPTDELVRSKVVPALVGLIEGDASSQLRASCIVALGRIGSRATGKLEGDRDLVVFLGEQLGRRQSRVAESALLALGLCADPDALQLLSHVLHDDSTGRTLTRRSTVPFRMRAVAAYALGLGAERAPIGEAKRYASHHLSKAFVERGASRDQQVACALALGLCQLKSGGQTPKEAAELPPSASREALVAFLLKRFDDERTEAFARAHTATSLGKLAAELDDEWRELVVDSLRRALARGGGGRNEVRQSAALALGMLADADAGGIDRRVRETLGQAIKHGDQQVRFFALIALAQVGSRAGTGPDPYAATHAVETQLMGQVQRGSSRGRPWAGLALGVLSRSLIEQGETPSKAVVDLLAHELKDTASPDDVGGHGIGLGLARGIEHREMLEERMWDYRRRDRARGDLLIAIGLLGETRSVERLAETMQFQKSRPVSYERTGLNLLFRPHVLERTSVALALLGHKPVVFTLSEFMGIAGSQESRVGVTKALAQVGDVRAVEPLIELLLTTARPSITRGEAASALGQICDPFLMPWRASYQVGVNYRASTETFADVDGRGILELR